MTILARNSVLVAAPAPTSQPLRRAALASPLHYPHHSRRATNPLVARAAQQQEVAEAPAFPTPEAAADPADRKWLSILPPFFSRETRLERLADGLWGLTQPFSLLGVDIRLRMVAARLPDGSLVLISPVAPTPEALRLLGSLGGDVKHIVLPSASPEHWLFAPALSNAFPDATVWVAPGFLEGRGLPIPFFGWLTRDLRPRSKVLGNDPLPSELQGQVESELLQVPFFIELALVLPQYRVLLLADTGFCMGAEDFADVSAANKAAAEKLGVWDRLGPVTKQVFQRYPKEGKAWVDAVLARGSFDTIIPGHATAPISDGPLALKACFDFLYHDS